MLAREKNGDGKAHVFDYRFTIKGQRIYNAITEKEEYAERKS